MIPRKFLFHTLSAVLLSLAISTAGFAATADTVTSSSYPEITESLEEATPSTAPEANIPAEAENTAVTSSENTTKVEEVAVKEVTAQENNDASGNTVSVTTASLSDAVSPTDGQVPVKAGTAEQKDNLTTTPSIEKVKETATPTGGHAPVSETEVAIPTTPAPTKPNNPAPVVTQPVANEKSKAVIIDPAPAPTPAPTPKQAPVVKGVSAVKYTVKKGDTLYLISKKFVTTITAIKNLNGLKSDWLYIGQILNVPSSGAKTTVASGNKTITVKKGDTLYLLSKRYGTTIAKIKSLNGLKSNTLWVGQKLKISASTTTATSASRATVSASRSEASRSEVILLARLIYGESRGESYEGQVAVGAVVLNRVRSSLFPNTIAGVIYQKNEFSVVLDGQINLTPNATAIKAAEAALSGYDPTGGALFYWNPVKAPNNRFLNSKPIIARIGSHVFAR